MTSWADFPRGSLHPVTPEVLLHTFWKYEERQEIIRMAFKVSPSCCCRQVYLEVVTTLERINWKTSLLSCVTSSLTNRSGKSYAQVTKSDADVPAGQKVGIFDPLMAITRFTTSSQWRQKSKSHDKVSSSNAIQANEVFWPRQHKMYKLKPLTLI